MSLPSAAPVPLALDETPICAIAAAVAGSVRIRPGASTGLPVGTCAPICDMIAAVVGSVGIRPGAGAGAGVGSVGAGLTSDAAPPEANGFEAEAACKACAMDAASGGVSAMVGGLADGATTRLGGAVPAAAATAGASVEATAASATLRIATR